MPHPLTVSNSFMETRLSYSTLRLEDCGPLQFPFGVQHRIGYSVPILHRKPLTSNPRPGSLSDDRLPARAHARDESGFFHTTTINPIESSPTIPPFYHFLLRVLPSFLLQIRGVSSCWGLVLFLIHEIRIDLDIP